MDCNNCNDRIKCDFYMNDYIGSSNLCGRLKYCEKDYNVKIINKEKIDNVFDIRSDRRYCEIQGDYKITIEKF